MHTRLSQCPDDDGTVVTHWHPRRLCTTWTSCQLTVNYDVDAQIPIIYCRFAHYFVKLWHILLKLSPHSVFGLLGRSSARRRICLRSRKIEVGLQCDVVLLNLHVIACCVASGPIRANVILYTTPYFLYSDIVSSFMRLIMILWNFIHQEW